MEPTPLQTAIGGNVLASGVLAFAFLYLWLQRREIQAPVFWGIAYLCYCVRQVLILIYAPAGPPLAADLLFIAVPLLILAGALLFLGRRIPYRLLALAAAILTLGAIAGYNGIVPRQAVWLPVMLGAAAITLFVTGGLLLHHNRRQPDPAHVILATLFVLWGAILVSFPFLLHSIPLRIGYYFANAVALLLLALTLIIASQRQQYRNAEEANQRFQDVVDTATAWIWEWDTERRIRFISPQVFDSLGIRPEIFIGRRFREVPGIAKVDISVEDAGHVFTTDGPFRNVPIDVVTDTGRRVRISVTGKPTFDTNGRHTGFRGITIDITKTARIQATLETVTAAVAESVGSDYFRMLVERLTRDLGVEHAIVARRAGREHLRTIAWFGTGAHHADVEYEIDGTPCAVTLARHLSIVETGVAALYPRDTMLRDLGIDSYASVALRSAAGDVIGLIITLSTSPIADRDLLQSVLTAIAPRAGAEMERQIAEAALRDSEARFRAVIDNMPIGFYLADAAGRFVQRNRTLEAWSGLPSAHYLGQTVREAAGDNAAEYADAEAEIEQVLTTGRTITREREFRGLSGDRRPALVIRFPILDSAGRVAFVATFINDLTNVRQLEAQVREREELFRTILDHMPMGFHLTDLEGKFVMRNRAIDEWGGVDRRDVMGRTHREVADQLPYDFEGIEATLREAIETRRPIVQERTDRHADGRERPLLITRYPIVDDAGEVRYVASLLTDLTEVKRLEAQVLEREKLFRTVIDNTPMAFQITDADTRVVLANRTLGSWLGVETDTLIGRTFRENGMAEARCGIVEAEHREVVTTGRTLAYEGDFVPLVGDPRPALIYRFPITDAAGNVTLVGTVAADLSERRQLQREVEEREQLLRAVIDNMPIGFLLTDPHGRVARRNQTLQSWSQRDNQLTIGQMPNDPTILAELEEVAASRQPLIRERTLTVQSGGERPVLVCRFPIVDSSGALNFVATLVTDLTEVKRLETQVREREVMFRTVIDNMPVAFHLTDAAGRVVQNNRTLESWGNVVQAGRTFASMDIDLAESDRVIVDDEIRQVRETGRTLVRERIDRTADGGQRPVLVCRFPIHDSTGKISLVASMVTDVSDLKRLEDQVRQSEARLQRVVAALDRSQKGVVVEDAGNRPIYVNRTAGELMGNESSAFAMLQRAGIGSEFESHGSWSGEIIHRTRSGNDAILQASVSRLPDGGTVTLLDDATERLERERRQVALEREVQEAQKMDAVGQLAGGIAHDFNNLIGAILGFARFIAEDTEEKSSIHGYAERILSASRRARDLIQQILSFSRRENAPRQPAPLSRLVEESAQLLRATVPATLDIEVRNDFAEAWSIVNQTQITQILVNLCLNAADAMAGRPGTLTLALERLPEVDPRLRWLLASDPGGLPRVDLATSPDAPSRCYVGALRAGSPYLVLSVRDQGSGIPPELLARIFDPFVTTKPRGQGTGLGLSVVQRLVIAHDGAIAVTSKPGTGTTFDIILPVSGRSSRDIVEAVTRHVVPAAAAAAASAAIGRVLVVDDDPHFGDMVSTALDRAGYEVGVCTRPREAIEVFSDQPERWDVLVTDQTMPEMSGLEMIGRLKTMHPGLRCILCTGYASSGLNAATAKAGGADAFFHKPVDIDTLVAAITRLTAPDTVR